MVYGRRNAAGVETPIDQQSGGEGEGSGASGRAGDQATRDRAQGRGIDVFKKKNSERLPTRKKQDVAPEKEPDDKCVCALMRFFLPFAIKAETPTLDRQEGEAEMGHIRRHTEKTEAPTSEAKTFLVSNPIDAAPTPSWDWITFAYGRPFRGGENGQEAIRLGS